MANGLPWWRGRGAAVLRRPPSVFKLASFFIWSTAVLLLLPQCRQETVDGAHGSRMPSEPIIEDVLEMAPTDAIDISITYWAAMREELQVGESESDEHPDPLLFAIKEAGFWPFWIHEGWKFPEHESVWGWTIQDLQWEASFITRESDRVYILKFNDDFDLSEIIQRFKARDYRTDEIGGISVYSHRLEISAPWYLGAPVFNVGVLSEKNALLFSDYRPAIKETIEVISGKTEAALHHEAFESLAGRIAGSVSSYFFRGDLICGRRSMPWAPGYSSPPARPGLIEKYRGNDYETAVASYFLQGDVPAGLFGLHYGDAADAKADLRIRTQAIEAESLSTSRPYTVDFFQLEEARVDENDLLLELSPTENGELALSGSILGGDFLYGAC